MLSGIALLIAVGLAVFVAAPLLSAGAVANGNLPVDVTLLGDLKRRRLVVYDNLKDLEFEFRSGKIAPEDYQALKENYLGEAAALLLAAQEAEELKQDDAMIEREVAARRARRSAAASREHGCPKCGFENPWAVKFCGECGARMAADLRQK